MCTAPWKSTFCEMDPCVNKVLIIIIIKIIKCYAGNVDCMEFNWEKAEEC
jgi:hypothetical protein